MSGASSAKVGTASKIVAPQNEAEPLIPALRRETAALAPVAPVIDVRTLREQLGHSIATARLAAALTVLFGGLALLLAVVGLYSVLSYVVTQNTHEIGIPLALGAQARDVWRLVIGQGLWWASWGIGLGLAGAFALTRLTKSLLFGVTATDPLTFAAVPLLLLLVALVACWLPARRATRVDPLVALRAE